MSIMLVCCSPRQDGNSDRLTARAQQTLDKADVLYLREYAFQPCTGCDDCKESGHCVRAEDDAERILSQILKADAVVWIAPVYFGGFDAHTKALIDRAQVFWNASVQKRRIPLMLVGVGGQRRGGTFEGLRCTMRSFGAVTGLKEKAAFLVFADRADETDQEDLLSAFDKRLRDFVSQIQ